MTVAKTALAWAALLTGPLFCASVAAAPAAPSAPGASVTISSCHPSSVQADRYVTFSATMSPNRRTAEMWIRFTLLERLSTDVAMHPVVAPGLGVWEKSAPGVAAFLANKSVTNLAAPASFRAVVSFRWYDAHRHLVMRTHRETAACTMR
jgi:hypothetical protein